MPPTAVPTPTDAPRSLIQVAALHVLLGWGQQACKRVEAGIIFARQRCWYLPLLLLFIPAWMAWHHACLVPHADHWMVVGNPWLKHLEGGSLWEFLHSPGNDSRHDVPKLLHWAVISLTGWNLRVEALLCVLITGLSVALLMNLCRRLPTTPARAWGLAWLAALTLLSPQQWMNWTWGIQLCYVLVVFGAAACIAAFASSLSLPLKALLAALAAGIAAMSFINGWLAWLLGFLALGVLTWQQGWRTRGVAIAWLLWCVALAATLGVFLYGWPASQIKHEQGMVQGLLVDPLPRLHFMLSLIGAPFAETWPTWDHGLRDKLLVQVAPWLGGGTLLLALFTALCLWHERAHIHWAALWPWALLALWGLGNSAAITLARSSMSLITPFESRYPAYILWFHIGLWGFMAVVQSGRGFTRLRQGWMLLMLWGYGVGAVQGWRDSLRMYNGCKLVNAASTMRLVAPEPVFLDLVMPTGGERVITALNVLDAHGLLHVATLHSERVSDATLSKDETWLGELKTGSRDAAGLHLKGWALNKQTRLDAPAIVISYTVEDQPEIWLGLATRRTHENKLAKKLKARVMEARIGWEYLPLSGTETAFMSRLPLTVKRKPLPNAKLTLRAYVLESESGVVTLLPGIVEVPAID